MNALSRFGKAVVAGFREGARVRIVLHKQALLDELQWIDENYTAKGVRRAPAKAKGSK